MSKLFIISDLHLGHKNVIKFRKEFHSVEEHDDHIIKMWNNAVSKYDTVYVLGDVAFSIEALSKLSLLNGKKVLIKGNHDTLPLDEYQKHFIDVKGLFEKKGIWFSHAPIHSDELRKRINIHGHTHMKDIKDDRYFNACCEKINYTPKPLEEILWLMR